MKAGLAGDFGFLTLIKAFRRPGFINRGAMDENIGGVVQGLVIIIVVSVAVIAGITAADLMGPPSFESCHRLFARC